MKRWAWMLVLLVGCGSDKDGPVDVEGDEAGECADGADNDSNGDFDCDDAGCEGSPDCEASDEGDEGSDDDGPATGDDDAGETGGSDTSGESDDTGASTSGDDASGDDTSGEDDGTAEDTGDTAEPVDPTDPVDPTGGDDGDIDFGTGADDDGDGYRASVDCDDTDPTVHPDAEEVCDGVDNDCNGMTDGEDTALSADVMLVFYLDADGDGFGVPDDTALGCEAPDGYAENPDDCNDDNPDSTLIRPWYMDADDDGFGDVEVSLELCDRPVGYIADFSDCDDARDDISPAAPETWGDSIDNNCNGETDEDDAIEGLWLGTTTGTAVYTHFHTCVYSPTAEFTCDGTANAEIYASGSGAMTEGAFDCLLTRVPGTGPTSGSCGEGLRLEASFFLTSDGGTEFEGTMLWERDEFCLVSSAAWVDRYFTATGSLTEDGLAINFSRSNVCLDGVGTHGFLGDVSVQIMLEPPE